MKTSFSDHIAKEYGVHIAIILDVFSNFTKFNAAKTDDKKRNFHEGRYWVYGTPEFWCKYFTFLSPKQIRSTLDKCIALGLLKSGNFNKHGYDRTKWYSLADKALIELNIDVTCSKPRNNHILPNGQMDLPKRAERYTPNKTPNKTTTSEQSSPPAPTLPTPTPLELVTVFAEELPSSPQPVVNVLTKTVDQKTRRAITEFKKYWKGKTGYELTVDKFREYLQEIKTNAPGFLDEYMNKGGKKQKNGLAVILYWENFEKYLNGTLF
jgi:hypothetical protein